MRFYTHIGDYYKTTGASFCPAWSSFGCSSGTTYSLARTTTASERAWRTACTRTSRQLEQRNAESLKIISKSILF